MSVEENNDVSQVAPGSSSPKSNSHGVSHTNEINLSPASEQTTLSPQDSKSPLEDSNTSDSFSTSSSLPSPDLAPTGLPEKPKRSKKSRGVGKRQKTDENIPAVESYSLSPRTGSDSGVDIEGKIQNAYNLSKSCKIETPMDLADNGESHSLERWERDGGDHEFYENGNTGRVMQYDGVGNLDTTPASPTDGSNIYQCLLCNLNCNSRHQYNEHLVTCSQRHECNECGFVTRDEKALRCHKLEVHNVCEPEAVIDEELTCPRVNSQGKFKTYLCKQCEYKAVTKKEFWDHVRTHMREDKVLTCKSCPFITEYKHHLEYHLRNHFGSKPYKCTKCPYSCVNKSMLNSHLKSHSNVYQYHCNDCTYATKYCHSLKLHLRKYDHSPAVVLNMDGTPNPYPIIDVYGTRRGPKMKNQNPTTDPVQLPAYDGNANITNNGSMKLKSNRTSVKSESNRRVKKEVTKTMKNNASSGAGRNRSRKIESPSQTVKHEPYYAGDSSPPFLKHCRTAVSASESNDDIAASNEYLLRQAEAYRLLQIQQHHLQQRNLQYLGHQIPQTPVSPAAFDLQRLLQNTFSQLLNGHSNQQQLQAAAVDSSAQNQVSMMTYLQQCILSGAMNPQGSHQELHPNQIQSQEVNRSQRTPEVHIPSPPLGNSDHRLRSPAMDAPLQESESHTALDLTHSSTMPSPETLRSEEILPEKRRRKGKAVRLDRKSKTELTHPLSVQENVMEEDAVDVALDFSNTGHTNSSPMIDMGKRIEDLSIASSSQTGPFQCKYCQITFPILVLYSLHMQFHSGDADPFLCKSCGKKSKNQVEFYLHIHQDPH